MNEWEKRDSTSLVEVTIIIPVFNGGNFIRASLQTLLLFLESQFPTFEVIAVNDGSTDDTLEMLQNLSHPHLRILSFVGNQGKCAAIQAGMKEARGYCRIFTDADLPFELEAIPYMVRIVRNRGFHTVIGDRYLSTSQYIRELTPVRALASLLFSAYIRLLVTGGIFDTQCGLKGFRHDVADALFPLLQEKGFLGDVEMLYIALKYNLEVKRIPVQLVRSEVSTVRVLSHGISMATGVLKLRYRWGKGKYSSEPLRIIAHQEYTRT